jgi:hypothetical protein
VLTNEVFGIADSEWRTARGVHCIRHQPFVRKALEVFTQRALSHCFGLPPVSVRQLNELFP